jgi:hypothetical protein
MLARANNLSAKKRHSFRTAGVFWHFASCVSLSTIEILRGSIFAFRKVNHVERQRTAHPTLEGNSTRAGQRAGSELLIASIVPEKNINRPANKLLHLPEDVLLIAKYNSA